MRVVALAALAALGGLAPACNPGKTCAAGDEDCEALQVCAPLRYSCDGDEVYLGTVADAPGGLGLAGAQAAPGDLVLRNGKVTAVLDALDTPHDLAPTGGNLLDFGPTGGRDELPLLYQLAGILPDDAFHYDTLTVLDDSGERAVIVLRGTLDGRDDVEVVTRYELRACEPGLRVRSELVNHSAEPFAFFLADAAHWGKRNVLPFAPQRDQGFMQPELDLVELGDAYFGHDYVVARPAEDDGPGYGFVPCGGRDTLDGVNDPEISALGTPFELVRPGEPLVLERFLVAAPGGDLDGAVAEVARARAMLHGDAPARTVTGRVVAGGLGFGGSLRRAAVLVRGDGRPLTMVVPGEDGRFTAEVPGAGDALAVEVWSFGRPVASASLGDALDAGDLEVALPAELTVSVVDGADAPLHALIALHPADDETRADVTGSWFGRFDVCAPWLGPPVGGSPACNRVLVEPGGATFELPAGRYTLWASAGPDHTLARVEVELGPGDGAEQELVLEALDVRPPGMLAADLHVHGQASFDSSIPDRDRVLSFAAAGIDVIAATDHDYIADYAAAIDESGLADRVHVLGGLETTGLIPFLDVPDTDIPRVIGHFNFWPLTPDPSEPRGGAPWDELMEPGELFDIMRPRVGESGVAMMNHPWDETQFGRDLGYLRAIEFDPREPIPEEPDGTPNGRLLERPGGGARNLDFDVIELENGAGVEEYLKARVLWFALLDAGHARPAAANSDSHMLTDGLGYGRTLVEVGGTAADLDEEAFDAAVREGRMLGGNGVVVRAFVRQGDDERGPSLVPIEPGGGDELVIEVRAAPWIPVTEVRVVTSAGERVLATEEDLDHPADPLGVAGVARYSAVMPLEDVIAASGDDWIVVEAGLPLPPAEDLDDDGVPDTSDNDGDGDIDDDDIEDEDDDSGPLEQPADPDDDEEDPRYAMTRVVPHAWPLGFTSPFLIDRGGDGWRPAR